MGLRLRYLPLLAAILAAAGCAADSTLYSEINGRAEHAHSRLETARVPAAEQQRSDPLEVTDSVWLGGAAVALKRGAPLPEAWEKNDSIAIRSDNPLTLSQIVAILSSQTKIPIRLTGGADQLDAASGTGNGRGQGGSETEGGSAAGMIISYEGRLSGLLDLVGGYFNVNWSYANGTLDISRYETRTFVLDALPGSITLAPPTDPGASEGAAASAQAVPLATASIDIWEDINRTLGNIIGTEGSITISQSSGTVVVSTTSDRMDQVAAFIQEENKRLSRQVAITIELYTVAINDDQSYGIDLQPVLDAQGFGGWLDLTFGGVPVDNLSGGSISVNLLKPPALAGTQGMFQALNTLGKTTRVAQIPITTLNNRPASQRIAVDQAYVSEVTTTVTDGSSAISTEITTDTVTTGISVSVLPRLMSDGRMLLQYALAQGGLIQLRNFAAGDNTIQLPETQGLSFSQQVMMKSGSTLVLAGFDQSDVSKDQSAPVRGLGLWLGGSRSNSQSRQLVVIAITPREIEVSNPEAS